MSLDDMILFNKQVQTVASETIDQQIKKFNSASGMTLILGSGLDIGDVIEKASYDLIKELIHRRDAYSDGAVPDTFIHQMLDVSIKVDRRVGPVSWIGEQFRRLKKSEEEAGMLIGEQMADGILQDFLNTLVGTLIASYQSAAYDKKFDPSEAGADKTYHKYSNIVNLDGGSNINPTLLALNDGAALFGDRSNAIKTWLMDGTTYHRMIGEAITNENRLFEIGNINVSTDGLGRRYIVSDIPDLRQSHYYESAITNGALSYTRKAYENGNKTWILGLTTGAGMIRRGGIYSDTIPIVGRENLGKRWQGEYSFDISLKGYKYGGLVDDKDASTYKSPTNEMLKNPENWAPIFLSTKDQAGVAVVIN